MAGKTNRKHGRNKRKPADMRYKAEQRWVRNAKRRHERHLKALVKKKKRHARRRMA